MSEIEFIDSMIAKLRTLKQSINKKNKLTEKTANMNHTTHTQNAIQKAHTSLNWECMYVSQKKTDVARLFKKSILDVGTEEKEYNPSGFHSYKY